VGPLVCFSGVVPSVSGFFFFFFFFWQNNFIAVIKTLALLFCSTRSANFQTPYFLTPRSTAISPANMVSSIFVFNSTISSGKANTTAPVRRASEMASFAFVKCD